MSNAGFLYSNIRIKRHGNDPWLAVTGDITNNSKKTYHTTLFRIAMFEQSVPTWYGSIKIRNFKIGQTRFFELIMVGLDYKILPKITKYDIFFESGY